MNPAGLLHFWRQMSDEQNQELSQTPSVSKRGPRGGLTSSERVKKYRAKKALEAAKKKEELAAKERMEAKKVVAKERKKFVAASRSGFDQWDYPEPADSDEARDALILDGVRDVNCQNQIIEEIPETCRDLGIIDNLFVYRHGVQARLQAQQGSFEPQIHEGWGGRSETLYIQEQFRLFDSMMPGRKLFGKETDFPSWLDYRDRDRKDLWFLSVDELRIPLNEKVHRPVTEEFYPKLNADGLLSPDYSLSDVHGAMSKAIGEVHDYLELDPRGHIKTGELSAFALQFLHNFRDARVWAISGTDVLASGLLRIVKSYLARVKGAEPTTHNLLWPEYALRGVDATSNEPILLPCRKHPQRDWSFWTSGISGAASGPHTDLCLQDDVVQEEGTEATREKLRNRIDNLSNVIDAHGARIATGTRYHRNDAYQPRIDLHDSDPTALRLLVRGACWPKEGCSHITLDKATLDDWEILWETRVDNSPEKTLADLKKRFSLNPNDFRHQMLNDPTSSDDLEKIIFEPTLLTSSVRYLDTFPSEGERFIGVDVAFSDSARADYSVIACVQVGLNEDELPSMFVHNVWADRVRPSELAYKVAEINSRFNPQTVLIESVHLYDLLQEKIYSEADKYGFPHPPLFKLPVTVGKAAKLRRIRPLEVLLREKRLIFAASDYVNLVFDQFARYDGRPSNAGRKKDDAVDILAILAEKCLPRAEVSKDGVVKAMEEAKKKREADQLNDMIFGSGPRGHVSSASDWLPEAQRPDNSALVDDNWGRSNWSWLQLNRR
jgi:hypothetical protein